MRAAAPTSSDPPVNTAQHLRPVEQQVGEVLSGVAGGSPGPQGQPAQVHLITVSQPPVAEGPAPGRGREDLRAVVGGQLQRPGQEVGMQVRVSGERGRQPVPHGGRPHRPQVPRHIDRQRPAIPQVHQVGRVPQPFIHDGHDQRSGHR